MSRLCNGRAQAVSFVQRDEPSFLKLHGIDDRAIQARDSRATPARYARPELLMLDDDGHPPPLAGLHDPAHATGMLPAVADFVGVESWSRVVPRQPRLTRAPCARGRA